MSFFQENQVAATFKIPKMAANGISSGSGISPNPAGAIPRICGGIQRESERERGREETKAKGRSVRESADSDPAS